MKEQLINLSREKGFMNRDSLVTVYDSYYPLWMCELQKWLREVHGIDLDSTTTFSKQYSFMCYQGQNPKPLFITNDFETYELALESALLEALNLIQTKP